MNPTYSTTDAPMSNLQVSSEVVQLSLPHRFFRLRGASRLRGRSIAQPPRVCAFVQIGEAGECRAESHHSEKHEEERVAREHCARKQAQRIEHRRPMADDPAMTSARPMSSRPARGNTLSQWPFDRRRRIVYAGNSRSARPLGNK
jgi:hypothetical protein